MEVSLIVPLSCSVFQYMACKFQCMACEQWTTHPEFAHTYSYLGSPSRRYLPDAIQMILQKNPSSKRYRRPSVVTAVIVCIDYPQCWPPLLALNMLGLWRIQHTLPWCARSRRGFLQNLDQQSPVNASRTCTGCTHITSRANTRITKIKRQLAATLWSSIKETWS